MMSDAQPVMGLGKYLLSLGYTELVPVIPTGATLLPNSKVSPASVGKCPGQFYGGGWDGFASWPEWEATELEVDRLDSLGANWGLKQGRDFVSLDVDILDDLTMQAVRQELARQGINAPIRVGLAPKALWLFRVVGEPIGRRQYPLHRPDVEGTTVVDVMGQTRKGRPTQAVVAGGHPSGATYTWEGAGLPRACDLPAINQEGMDRLVEVVLTVCDGRGWGRGRPSASGGSGFGQRSDLAARPHDMALVPAVMNSMGNDYGWDDWVRVGLCLCTVMGHEEGWSLFEEWSKRSPKYEPKETARRWLSFEPDGSMTFGTLVNYARERGSIDPILDARISGDSTWRKAVADGMPPNPAPPMIPPKLPSAEVVVKATRATLPGVENEPDADLDVGDFTRDSNGRLVPNAYNAHIWINSDARWKNCFAFDAFANRPVILSPLPMSTNPNVPRPMDDNDFTTARLWFQREGFNRMGKGDVIDAIESTCRRNTFEPVKEYLRGLPAVTPGLLDNWLFIFMNVQKTGVHMQDHYVSTVGRKWMIGAVARAMTPGCQMDNVLVFEGPQGTGKSSALRALCPNPEWFGDALPEFTNKDSSSYLNGKWIVEMAELASVKKSDIEDMRSFLTRRVEDYRPSHGRLEQYLPRRCVFAGTTNRDDYLKDSAGERRMWPVHVGKSDIPALIAGRDQLWRESYDAFLAGEGWHLDEVTEQQALSIQKQRVDVDAWVESIEPLVSHMTEVSTHYVMTAMGMTPDKRHPGTVRRIGDCLKYLGYETKNQFRSGEYKGSQRYVKK